MKHIRFSTVLAAAMLLATASWAGGDSVPVDQGTGYVPFAGVEIGGLEKLIQ